MILPYHPLHNVSPNKGRGLPYKPFWCWLGLGATGVCSVGVGLVVLKWRVCKEVFNGVSVVRIAVIGLESAGFGGFMVPPDLPYCVPVVYW